MLFRSHGIESGETASEKGTKIAGNTAVEQTLQMDFLSAGNSALTDALRAIDVTTLTPIEAMNKLYELQKML